MECSRLSSLQGRRAAGQWAWPLPSHCSWPVGLGALALPPRLAHAHRLPSAISGTGGRMPPAPWWASSRARGLSPDPPTVHALGMVLLAAALLSMLAQHPQGP